MTATPANLERRKCRLERSVRILIGARVLMRFDGYAYADDVLASDNPKCVKWRSAAEAFINALDAHDDRG